MRGVGVEAVLTIVSCARKRAIAFLFEFLFLTFSRIVFRTFCALNRRDAPTKCGNLHCVFGLACGHFGVWRCL